MTERYHYDKDGNYIGKTSDQPPPNGCAGILLIIFLRLFSYRKKKIKVHQIYLIQLQLLV